MMRIAGGWTDEEEGEGLRVVVWVGKELELQLELEDGEVGESGSGGSWSMSVGGDDDDNNDGWSLPPPQLLLTSIRSSKEGRVFNRRTPKPNIRWSCGVACECLIEGCDLFDDRPNSLAPSNQWMMPVFRLHKWIGYSQGLLFFHGLVICTATSLSINQADGN